MSYELGTHINLEHINKQNEVKPEKRASFRQTVSKLVEVGTSYTFRQTPEGYQAARRIAVSFA